MKVSIALASAASLASLLSGGCSSNCGINIAPSGSIGQNGAVTFQPVALGQSEKLSVPIEDSTDDAETITAAQIAGPNPGAFQVLTAFPLLVPIDGGTTVVIEFTPSQAGAVTAELTLTTEEDAPMSAPLSGTGIAPSGS